MGREDKKPLIEDHYQKLEEQYGIEFLAPSEVKEALRDYVRTSDFSDPDIQHFCVMGEPGCGKTAIPKAICIEEDVNLLIIRASNIDEGVLGGYPGQVPGELGAVDLYFVKYYKDKLEEFIANGKKIMIFFDELNRAKDHIIQSTFNIIDRKIIANFELPIDRTMFMVSINPATDAHTVRDIIGKEAALNRRFEVYGMKAEAKSFVDYLTKSVPDAHPMIVEYIRNHPDRIMGLEHMSAGKKFACPAIYKTFSRQLTAMEKAGVNLVKLSKYSTKVRRLNAAFGTGEGQALLSFIMDRSRHITPTMVLENYDKIQPLIKGEMALVLKSTKRPEDMNAEELYDELTETNARQNDDDDDDLPIDSEMRTADGKNEALDMGQLSKLASDVAAYVANFKPDLLANPIWAKNLARFMNDLPNDPLKMFLEKLHITMEESNYSESLVKALSGIAEFVAASHRQHKYTREAAKATDQSK